MAGAGLYAAAGLDEPPLFFLLIRFGWLWVAGWWLTDDLRRRRERWLYCPGLFVALASPLVLPYHLLKTRGPRALITLAVFIAVSVAALATGSVIGLMLTKAIP